jgi:antitoxin (DNA-binding transcriptional repressor) of toxin-antitoxin stability system
MRAKFLREVADAGLPRGPWSRALVSEADLAPLPEPAQRYLRFMRVLSERRVWSFRVHWKGEFRRHPGEPFSPCEAWQYNSSLEIARIFHMRLRYAGVLPLLVRDTYLRGRGRMQGKLLDAFNVVDVADYKIDTGELVTYLNDALTFAPSMLLGPEVNWSEHGQDSFEIELTDHDRTVAAIVFVDERGAMTDFSTSDRYGEDPAKPGTMLKTRWSTPIAGWNLDGRKPLPTGASAIWHFTSGEFEYARFKLAPRGVELDVVPG